MHKILVVEDHYLERDWICFHLSRAFGGTFVQAIETEFEFQTRLDEIGADNPDVIIMDVMLPWTLPSPNIQEPPETVKREGFYSAGLRCKKMLDEREDTKNIPVLLYTVLSEGDLQKHEGIRTKNMLFLHKDPDPEVLIERIRELLDGVQRRELGH